LRAHLQEPIQHERLGLLLEQACAKRREQGGIKARIAAFHASGIFPVNALAHSIDCLPIHELLGVLQH
jgi:hypothetical protein